MNGCLPDKMHLLLHPLLLKQVPLAHLPLLMGSQEQEEAVRTNSPSDTRLTIECFSGSKVRRRKSARTANIIRRFNEDDKKTPRRIYRIYKYLSFSLSKHQISLLLQQIQTPKQNPSLDIQSSSHVFYSRLWSLLLDSCFIIS